MKRIQRKRERGWRMPVNTVYVGRPTKWGNPWLIQDDDWQRRYRRYLEMCLEREPDFLEPLKGKNLACWCALDQACHADIILEFLEAKK